MTTTPYPPPPLPPPRHHEPTLATTTINHPFPPPRKPSTTTNSKYRETHPTHDQIHHHTYANLAIANYVANPRTHRRKPPYHIDLATKITHKKGTERVREIRAEKIPKKMAPKKYLENTHHIKLTHSSEHASANNGVGRMREARASQRVRKVEMRRQIKKERVEKEKGDHLSQRKRRQRRERE